MIRVLSRADRRVGWLVFAVALVALVAGGETQGNMRDEGYYFDAAELYWSWYGDLVDNTLHGAPQRSLSRAAVTRGFGYNHEHPALMKTLFGFSWRFFHKCHCPEQARPPSDRLRARRTDARPPRRGSGDAPADRRRWSR